VYDQLPFDKLLVLVLVSNNAILERIHRYQGGLGGINPPNILMASPLNRNFVRNFIRYFYNLFIIICSFFFENRKIRNNKKLFTIALIIPIT
jgi:hypothetical protein